MFKNLKLFVFVFISLMTVFITSCTPPSAPSVPELPPVPVYNWTEDYSEVTLSTIKVKVTGTVNYSTSEPTESTYSTFYFDESNHKLYCRTNSSGELVSDELVVEDLSKYLNLFVTTNPIGDYKKDELCAIIGTDTDNTVYQYGENGTVGLYSKDNRGYRYVKGTIGEIDVGVKPLDKFGYILYANGTIRITGYDYNEDGVIDTDDAGDYVNTAIGQISDPLPIYVY